MDAKQIETAYKDLLKQPIDDAQSLEKWILATEEVGVKIQDRYSRAHVASTVDTTDKKAEEDLMYILENILPLTEKYGFELNRKLLASPAVSKLDAFYACYLRAVRTDVELFREENIALKIEERKLVNEFEKIMGGFSAEFRGKTLTMPQLAVFLENPDRATREEAFKARANVRRKHATELDKLYDQMLAVRGHIAKNAGYKNFRDYQFAAYHRFDYTPDDCVGFHAAIADAIVPIVSRAHKERMKKLGVSTLKPWDTKVDPDATEAILPFKNSKELINGCKHIFDKVDRELGGFFDVMMKEKLLDLDSRQGKAPGGYCTQFSEARVPFIFMNAAGMKSDVDTLLHEGGHSFHYFLARDIKLPAYHSTGLEFAEVASMAMELLSRPYFAEFYKGDTLPRVLRDQLRKILEFFPFMAMIDAFQHWVYTAKTPNAAERAAKWASLEKKYQPVLDWSGFEEVRDLGWQYPHVFSVPFYYVEYGIAQLGALAIWKQSLADHGKAVARYKSGLKLGGSRPLPELFKAVGAEFGMNTRVIAPLVETVAKESGL